MSEKFYSFEKASEEAEKMKGYVDRGASKNYSEAEKKLEGVKKVESIKEKLKEKYDIKKIPSQLEDQLRDIVKVFGDIDNVKDKKILDIGCGSNSETYETDRFNALDRSQGKEPTRFFEPWLCRALAELGAKPVGIDIGNLEGEEFEHYRVDLSKTGALDFLPEKSFDGMNMRLLITSPHLEDMTSKQQREDMVEELEKQFKRLLKDDGKIIRFDTGKF